jgi:membrane protein implicated in regulation of membrane protease activity
MSTGWPFDQPGLLWGLVAVALLIVEVIMIHGFFLPWVAAAVVLAVVLGAGFLTLPALWQLVAFAALGLALVMPVRRGLRGRLAKSEDINRY